MGHLHLLCRNTVTLLLLGKVISNMPSLSDLLLNLPHRFPDSPQGKPESCLLTPFTLGEFGSEGGLHHPPVEGLSMPVVVAQRPVLPVQQGVL